MFFRNTDIGEEHELSDTDFTDSYTSIYTLNVICPFPVRGLYHYKLVDLTQGNVKYE